MNVRALGCAAPLGTRIAAAVKLWAAGALLIGHAHGAEPLTLDRATALARERNPEILAAREELVVARGRLEKAQYWNPFNPQIEGGAAERRFEDGGSATQRSGGLSLEVEIAGQRGKRIEEAERNLARVNAQVANVERNVTADVAEALYRAVYSRDRLALSRRVETLNLRLRDATVERFKSGEAPKLDANLAVVRYTEARRQTLASERDYRNAIRGLERLIGAEPLGTPEISGALSIGPLTAGEEALVDAALRSRPDLRAREAEIERVGAEIALTRRLIVPNPTLAGRYEEEAESAGGHDRIVGGSISVPLPIFDRKTAELTQLSGERAKAVHERAGTELAVRAEVRDAFRSYEAAREAAQAFEVDAAGRIDESLEFVETAHREGKIDVLEFIVAANDLVSARVSYLDLLLEHALARVALERGVGRSLGDIAK